jgi:hypothetical protein
MTSNEDEAKPSLFGNVIKLRLKAKNQEEEQGYRNDSPLFFLHNKK